MGLDTVELVIETEETFGIQIDDNDTGNIGTVGNLYEYICNKCAHSKDICVTQKAFYITRKHLSELLNMNKKEIKPKSLLKNIAQHISNKELWDGFSKKTSLALPPLELPIWIICFVLFLSLLGLWFLDFVLFSLPLGDKFFYLLIAWPFAYLALAKLFSPLRIAIPVECRSIGGLSKQVLRENTQKFEPLSKNEIWEILVKMIADQSGLEVEEIKPEKSFREIFPYDYK